MTIVGIGVDVCEIARFEAMARRTPGAVTKVLCPAEAALPLMASKAGRFAAKEALAKALGAPRGMAWQDCEVVVSPEGQPSFELRGTVAERVAALGIGRIHLSLSHDGGVAVAMVVCED